MKKEETLYTQWKHHRRQVPVPEGFTASVMAGLDRGGMPMTEDEQQEGAVWLSNRLLKWSSAAGLVFLGLFRIVFITVSLLRANLLMPN